MPSRTNNAFRQPVDSAAPSRSLNLLSDSATQRVPQSEHQQVIQQWAEVTSLTDRNDQQQVVDIRRAFCRIQLSAISAYALACRKAESAIQNTIRDRLSNNRADIEIEGALKVTRGPGNIAHSQIKTMPKNFPITSTINPHPLSPILPGSAIYKSDTQQWATLDGSRASSAVSSQPPSSLPYNPNLPTGLNDDYGNRKSAHRRRRRSFSCNQCNETNFHVVRQLDEHTMRVHGLYRCHRCPNRTYTARSNYMRHSLVHLDFEPLQCRICKIGYYRRDHLMKHMANHHPTANARENIIVHRKGSQGLDHPNTS
ncbi:unnamed protein product [Hymenolepis diminuta]|nr:unnamed protein product [Hymenolepis diminuta]VUZ57595.1 unnamed protein product [Hymenolepis diminuta]VUZ57596.1 unnamed protein product [Hymenolepis diminuta]